MISAVLSGLATGYKPILAMDGTGGTYFVKDGNGWEVAVFKPQDEEPYAPHNVSVAEITRIISPSYLRGTVASQGVYGIRTPVDEPLPPPPAIPTHTRINT